jgi:hypothetical protein
MKQSLGAEESLKHIDHCVGSGIIIKHLGTRSKIIRYKEKDFQKTLSCSSKEIVGPFNKVPVKNKNEQMN